MSPKKKSKKRLSKIISSFNRSEKFFSSNHVELQVLLMPKRRPIGFAFCPKIIPFYY